jgi:hypothetical protein
MWNRPRDLRVCSTVPQPPAPPLEMVAFHQIFFGTLELKLNFSSRNNQILKLYGLRPCLSAEKCQSIRGVIRPKATEFTDAVFTSGIRHLTGRITKDQSLILVNRTDSHSRNCLDSCWGGGGLYVDTGSSEALRGFSQLPRKIV